MRAKIALPSLMLFLVSLIFLADPSRGDPAPQFQFKKGGGGDPKQKFEERAKGRGFYLVSEMDNQFFKDKMEAFLQENGVKDGKMTYELYQKMLEGFQKGRGQNPKKGGNEDTKKSGDTPAKDAPSDTDAKAKVKFDELDTSPKDGFLDLEELKKTQQLIREWEKWDLDGDKKINLSEYQRYFRAHFGNKEERTAARAEAKGSDASKITTPKTGTIVIDEEDAPVRLIYLAAKDRKLPADLPDWFAKLDKDKDGQITLYEWNAGCKDVGKDLDDFLKMDRNQDCILTVEEVLYYERFVKTGNSPRPDLVASTINPNQKQADSSQGNNPYRQKGKDKKKGPRMP